MDQSIDDSIGIGHISGCPFCGGSALIRNYMFYLSTGDTITYYYASCNDCGAQGPVSQDKDTAKDKWQQFYITQAENMRCNNF